MWRGSLGLVLVAELVLATAGLNWAAWLGVPSQITEPNNRTVSRGKYHLQQVSQLRWWLSAGAGCATIMAAAAFLVTALCAFQATPEPNRRNYGPIAAIVGLGGLVLGVVGTCLSAL